MRPCRSILCAPDLLTTVKERSGVTFVVARTTIKKSAPAAGADAKFICLKRVCGRKAM